MNDEHEYGEFENPEGGLNENDMDDSERSRKQTSNVDGASNYLLLPLPSDALPVARLVLMSCRSFLQQSIPRTLPQTGPKADKG